MAKRKLEKVNIKVIPVCVHCGGKRVGMKKYKNPYTGEEEYLHDICHKGLVAKFNYQEAKKESDEAEARLREDDN